MRRSFYFIFLILIINLILLGITLNPYQAKAEIAAAIIVDPVEGLITDENGGSDFFTIQLDSEPTNHVILYLYSSNPDEGSVSTSEIFMNRNKWEDLYLVDITGVADGIEDGDVPYEITGVTSSSDPNFNGLVMPSVSVTNLNDPVPIANDDHPPINGYSQIIVPVLENDSALIDLPIEISVVNDPSYGTYSINPDPDNTITYSPSSETFLGIDQFTYQVCDFDGDCASAEVIIEDQVPPEIISVTPVDIGETYEVFDGEIMIEVEVSDNFQVDCVEFIRWDAIGEQFIALGEDCLLPYQLTINSSSLNYGWNQVYIRASDIAGNFSPHNFIWLYRITRTYLPIILSP
ncbi:MAG: hypothetical protein JJE12_14025 [Anaerolineales bacterium]|nr:hypothetical protein [Anaerolineales bacterium]